MLVSAKLAGRRLWLLHELALPIPATEWYRWERLWFVGSGAAGFGCLTSNRAGSGGGPG